SPAPHPALLRGAPLSERIGPPSRLPGAARLLTDRLPLRGTECGLLRPDLPGTGAWGFRHPQLRLGAVVLVHVPDLGLRLRGAEAQVPARHGARGTHRLLRSDRAARWI